MLGWEQQFWLDLNSIIKSISLQTTEVLVITLFETRLQQTSKGNNMGTAHLFFIIVANQLLISNSKHLDFFEMLKGMWIGKHDDWILFAQSKAACIQRMNIQYRLQVSRWNTNAVAFDNEQRIINRIQWINIHHFWSYSEIQNLTFAIWISFENIK